MSQTRNFAVSKDNGLMAPSYGNGAGTTIWCAYDSGGTQTRMVLQFTPNWTDVTSIVSAVLHIRSGALFTKHAETELTIRRVTAYWAEGTFNGGDNGAGSQSGAYANYGGPPVTDTDKVDWLPGTGNNTWKEVDITDIVRAWAPSATVEGGGDADNYGISIRQKTEGTSNRGWDAKTRESGYGAYITLTYETNRAPNEPTCETSGVVAGVRPTITINVTDPDLDNISEVEYEIAEDDEFASVVDSDTLDTGWASGSDVEITPGIDLDRGATYYFRARATDENAATGDWGEGSFTINELPTLSGLLPVAGGIAPIWNLSALAEWTAEGAHAAPMFGYSADPEGAGQYIVHVRLRVYSAAVDGDLLYDYGGEFDEDLSPMPIIVPDEGEAVPWELWGTYPIWLNYALVNGTSYWWTIEVWDSLGESSGESARMEFHVQWGQAIYEYAPSGGSSSSQWEFSASGVAENTQSGFAFATATDTGGVGRSDWTNEISSLAPDAYLNVLVRVATYDSETQPALPDMTFTYVGAAVQPDRWTVSPSIDWALDRGQRRFGTQSLKCTIDADGDDRYAYPYRHAAGDDVAVQAGTTYTLSGFVKTAAPLAHGSLSLRVYQAGGFSTLKATSEEVTDTSGYANGWQRVTVTFTTAAGQTTVRPCFYYDHADASDGDVFWVDAMKLEEGTVATAWTPGFVGDPVVLDVNGVSVDGAAGGIFRLRGTDGGAFDTLSLGAHGLVFGADVEVYSSESGLLHIDGNVNVDGDLEVTGDVTVGQLAGLVPIEYGLNPQGYISPSSVGSYSGYWLMFAIGTIESRYHDCNLVALVCGYGSSDATSTSYILRVRVKQQAAFGSQPAVDISIDNLNAGSPDDVCVDVMSVAGPTMFAVYVRNPKSYQYLQFLPLDIKGAGGTWAFYTPDGYTYDAPTYATSPYRSHPGQSSVPRGTAFPASPQTYDRYFRTDLGEEYFYDGTRWVSSQLYFGHAHPTFVQPFSANNTVTFGGPLPTSYWAVSMEFVTFHSGSPMSSNYWSVTGNTRDAGNTATPRVSFNTNGDTSANWTRHGPTAIGAVLTDPEWDISIVKHGSPGSVYVSGTIVYRKIAT